MIPDVYAPAMDYNTKNDGGFFLWQPYITVPNISDTLNFTLAVIDEMKGDVKVVPSQEADVFSYVASGAELVFVKHRWSTLWDISPNFPKLSPAFPRLPQLSESFSSFPHIAPTFPNFPQLSQAFLDAKHYNSYKKMQRK